MGKVGRPKEKIMLSEAEHSKLEILATSSTDGRNVGKRAKIILLSSIGIDNKQIARRLDVSEQTVFQWRQRYLSEGISGLKNRPRSGRKSQGVVIHEEDRETLL